VFIGLELGVGCSNSLLTLHGQKFSTNLTFFIVAQNFHSKAAKSPDVSTKFDEFANKILPT
jgi:hypothetical protein